MASLFQNEQLPTTSEQAIRIFDERYLAGISVAPVASWASDLGDVIDLTSPRVTFPIGLLSTKYIETREETGRFRTMLEQSFDLKVVEYDAGYEAKLMDLKTLTYAYRKWTQIPARFINAENRHVSRSLAALLEDGLNQISPWDGLPFFSASHKANPASGTATWSNYQAVATDVLNMSSLSAELTAMAGVLDENGEKIGANPDTIIVPTAKYLPLVFTLAQALVLNPGATAPSSNPFIGRFKVVHAPELTDVNDWYLVDSKLMSEYGVPPWVAAKYRAPSDLGLRTFDETSDYFKNTGNIKVSSHLWYGFKLIFPQAIRRVVGI